MIRTILLALCLLSIHAAARADCPPPVTNLVPNSSLCGGQIQLTFSAPQSGLNFPQVFRAPLPNLFFAQQIGTGLLNSTSFLDTPSSIDVASYYWVRWQGLDSNCPVGPFTGPVEAISIEPGLSAIGGFIPAPAITVDCSSVILSWPRFREANSVTIFRGTSTNVGASIATVSLPNTSFADTTGIPGTTYAYRLRYNSTGCTADVANTFALAVFPPFVAIPSTTPADVTSGQNATLGVSFASASPGLATSTWFRGDSPVTDVPGRISGSSTTSLQFTPALPQDEGIYTLRASTPCVTLPPINVALIVRSSSCTADFNNDHAVGIQDIFDFLNAWFAGCP